MVHLKGRSFEKISHADSRIWIDTMLREIRAHVPRMLDAHANRGEFWLWFCGEAESALRSTSDQGDKWYFEKEVNEILSVAGLEERFVPAEWRRCCHCVK